MATTLVKPTWKVPVLKPNSTPVNKPAAQPTNSPQAAAINRAAGNLGNNGVGNQAAAGALLTSGDNNAINADIARTQQVIANRSDDGLDVGLQNQWLAKLQAALVPVQAGGAGGAGQGQAPDLNALATQRADAYFQSQSGLLEQQKNDAIAHLEQSYNQAVQDGQISVRDAQAAFDEQKKTIEAQHYNDAESTALAANDLGIQNSQQRLGLAAGDNARNQNLNNTNLSARDQRIGDIQTRLSTIMNQKNADVGRINANHAAQLTAARGQADMMAADQQFQLGLADHSAGVQFNNQSALLALGNKYDLGKLGVQQGFAQDNMQLDASLREDAAVSAEGRMLTRMGIEQQYNLESLDHGSRLRLTEMAKNQEYDVANMATNFANGLKSMQVANGYDMAKMSAAFTLDLQKMSKQYGYDKAMQSESIKAAQSEYASKIKAEEAAYELARSRELSKYRAGTPEYAIAQGQLKSARDANIAQIHAESVYKATAENVLKNAPVEKPEPPSGKDGLFQLPWYMKALGITDPNIKKRAQELEAYERQLDKYNKAQSFMNGGG